MGIIITLILGFVGGIGIALCNRMVKKNENREAVKAYLWMTGCIFSLEAIIILLVTLSE